VSSVYYSLHYLLPDNGFQHRNYIYRWVDNIIVDLREIGWDGVQWIDMAQDRDK
jgi:hypothetical protein